MISQIESTVNSNSNTDKRRLNTPDIESDKYIRVEESSIHENDKSRKKPGRKPSTAEPANKRLAQNRAAQRAFRERKDIYVKELETKIQELENSRRLVEEENKKLQLRLSQFQNASNEKNDLLFKDSPSKHSESSEDRTVVDTSSETAKVFDFNSGDSNIDNWSSPQKNSLSTPQTNDISFNFLGNSLPQTSSFSQIPKNNSIISPPSAFSMNDYMIPYGSLTQDPLIDYNSGMNINQSMMSFNSYDANLGFNPALFDYSTIANNSFPTDFTAFDPVGYADFIQSYDPYNLSTFSNVEPSFGSLNEVIPPPIATATETNTADANKKNTKLDANSLKKAADEFDLDSLCSMLKNKATCSEIKQFFKSHCKDSVTL